MAKLTKKMVDAVIVDTKRKYLWDDLVPGFGVLVLPNGKKFFILQYRNAAGTSRRFTIGRYGVLTIDQARDQARALVVRIGQGEDPVVTRSEARSAETVDRLVEMYRERHLAKKKPNSRRTDNSMIDLHVLPNLGKKQVKEVNRADIARLHHKLRKTPYAANRVLALLSKLFNLAEVWGLRPENANPCTRVQKFKETARKRYLNGDELAHLGATLAEAETDSSESPFAVAAIRLLLLTGARLNEILSLKWKDVDLDRGCLHLEDSKTGAKEIMLNGPALEVLETLPRMELNPYVIPGEVPGKHLVNLNKPWRRIRKRADIPDVRCHDLRHSFASVAAAAGLGLPLLGALLGHSQPATTARYAHLANDPLRAAAELIGEKINEAMSRPVQQKMISIIRHNHKE